MLCLKRKKNMRVFIDHPDGTRVTVMVTEIFGGDVVLGFDAPPEVKIVREEAISREPKHAKAS